jgi:hypothetical protein
MAIIALNSVTEYPTQFITWAALANTDTGQPYPSAKLSDKTVQVFGTFGTGGAVTMQGSNDPRVITDPTNAQWVTLTDTTETAIVLDTTTRAAQILQNFRYVRPNVTAGDGATSLTVIICAKGDY